MASRLLRLVLCSAPLLLAACGSGGLPPPGPTSALAPAGADPGATGVSGEVGSGARGFVPRSDEPGPYGAPLGTPDPTGPGPVPNAP